MEQLLQIDVSLDMTPTDVALTHTQTPSAETGRENGPLKEETSRCPLTSLQSMRSSQTSMCMSPFRIFVSTFNMGKCSSFTGDIAEKLADWIPPSEYQLYAIAVQRCRILPRLKQAIQAHLGKTYMIACFCVKKAHCTYTNRRIQQIRLLCNDGDHRSSSWQTSSNGLC